MNHYKSPPPQTFQYAVFPFDSVNVYDNLSDESNAGSPQAYEQMFPGLGALDYPIYPYSSPTTGFIVRSSNVSHSTDNETDGGHVLEDDGRRKRRQSSARDKDSLSQIHSRRRAQNRASQRAFRDRKEKHVKDLERRYDELEGKHKALQISYSELSASQDALTREIEHLRRSSSSGCGSISDEQDFERISLDGSLLYSGPAFYFDNDLLDTHKEMSPGQV
ncbi:MAG: hypothetical protein M1813_001647 [Trichoglossum hirsutum]|nr:MAG: hypothetical protein M1813_001647 [Trichoglossum hirsutum]